MSGGHFDYKQYYLNDIANDIQLQIETNGKPNEYGENITYSDATIARFKEAVYVLKVAETYAQRIDWLISGDDGEDSFIERINDELNQHLESFK